MNSGTETYQVTAMTSWERQKEGPSAAVQAKKCLTKKKKTYSHRWNSCSEVRCDAMRCKAAAIRGVLFWRDTEQAHVLYTKLPLEGYKPRRFQPLAWMRPISLHFSARINLAPSQLPTKSPLRPPQPLLKPRSSQDHRQTNARNGF